MTTQPELFKSFLIWLKGWDRPEYEHIREAFHIYIQQMQLEDLIK